MLGSGTRAVISPERNGQCGVDLRNGTVTALLDPNRDKVNGPRFSIRTKTGVTEATGTFTQSPSLTGRHLPPPKRERYQRRPFHHPSPV